MPPRIPLFQCLRAQNVSQSPSISRSFSSTPSTHASTITQKCKHRDPYAIAQAKARKTANLSRQEVLKKKRAVALGDPVRGTTTPFVQSFDTGLSSEPAPSIQATKLQTKDSPRANAAGPKASADEHLNFYVSKTELDLALKRSRQMTSPPPDLPGTTVEPAAAAQPSSTSDEFPDFEVQGIISKARNPQGKDTGLEHTAKDFETNTTPAQRAAMVREGQASAEEAMKRIASLSLASSKDRLRLNKQRIVDEFGRHNTDTTLPPKPRSPASVGQPEKVPRVGPDTGSSEVQVGILTAKIRAVADYLDTRGHMDKVNKRNLRLLVHRRAKLLNYLRRKERGGPRWQHVIETLGLTEGTWKGEITL